LSERPINKTTMIPMTENPPRRMGIRILRSKAGWLSMENRDLIVRSIDFADDLFMNQAV